MFKYINFMFKYTLYVQIYTLCSNIHFMFKYTLYVQIYILYSNIILSNNFTTHLIHDAINDIDCTEHKGNTLYKYPSPLSSYS